MFKKLTKNTVKEKISLAKLKKFDSYLTIAVIVLNAAIIVGGYYLNTLKYNLEYIKSEFIVLLVIYFVTIAIFYYTYNKVTKNKPGFVVLTLYTTFFATLAFILTGINILLETLMNKASFTTSNTIFVSLTLLLSFLLISRYDFPLIGDFKQFILAALNNFEKNLAVFMLLAFLIAVAGVLNTTLVYGLAIIPVVLNIYMFKTLLSNVRK